MYLMLIMLILTIIFNLIFMLSKDHTMKKEKLFSFECGFNPCASPRSPFSIQFFKILLIFLLFDIEIILILPIPLYTIMNMYSLTMISIIILFLLLGLYFEWKEGTLNWLK